MTPERFAALEERLAKAEARIAQLERESACLEHEAARHRPIGPLPGLPADTVFLPTVFPVTNPPKTADPLPSYPQVWCRAMGLERGGE